MLLTGKKSATLYDVARVAGVSTATVSRAMHDQAGVREATRARVKQAIAELGYVPDGAAQSLSRGRKDAIGLLVADRPAAGPAARDDMETTSLLFWDEVLRSVATGSRSHDTLLMISFGGLDDDPGFRRLEALSGKVDGLLICEGTVPSPIIDSLAARIPVAIVGGTPSERAADVVTADNRSGSAAIVTHLVRDHGRRQLFLVDGPPYSSDASERRIGVEQALCANPPARLVGSHQGFFDVRSGEAAAERLVTLPREDLPDAVVAANDQMAIGVLRTLTQASIRVPQDVAVVGFDDAFLASLCHPALTTVYQPVRTMGARACARLFDRIADPSLRCVAEVLPTELVLRSSCGCPPGTDVRRSVPTPEPLPAGWPGALPDHQGGGQLDMVRLAGGGGPIRVQHAEGGGGHGRQGLADSGQGGRGPRRHRNIIETDHAQVARGAQPAFT